jgi:hypothetical protein
VGRPTGALARGFRPIYVNVRGTSY